MSFVLITAPVIEPLAAAEVRLRLNNISAAVVDATLDALIQASRLRIERQYGIALITQTLDYLTNGFPTNNCNSFERGFYPPQRAADPSWRVGQSDIVLPMSPVQTIMTVTYSDENGISQTLDPSAYVLSIGDLCARISPAFQTSWPTTQQRSAAVKIRFKAGFGDLASAVPETLKTVIALQVNHLRSMMEQNIFVTADSVIGVGQKSYSVGRAGTDVIDQATTVLMQDYVRPSL